MAASNTTATNGASVSSHASLKTVITTREDLSLLYRVLRAVIKPFRPRLTTPGKPLPAGSPQLSKHDKIRGRASCNITERQDEFGIGLWVYDFEPKLTGKQRLKEHGEAPSLKEQTSHQRHMQEKQRRPEQNGNNLEAGGTQPGAGLRSKHKVLFFAGGGFQSPPSPGHWRLVAKLAREFPEDYQFQIVSYPLAPHSPASVSIPLVRKYLEKLIAKEAEAGGSVTLMGDSAGGNIALSLGMWWCAEMNCGKGLQSEVTKLDNVLKNIIAISPAVEMTNKNPDIETRNRLDPILTKELTESVAALWSGTPTASKNGKIDWKTDEERAMALARDDPQISPLFYDGEAFAKVASLGIQIHGVIGTSDVLAPDAELFMRKCRAANIPGRWLIWQNQMHCFLLAGVSGVMREGVDGIKFVEDILKDEAKR